MTRNRSKSGSVKEENNIEVKSPAPPNTTDKAEVTSDTAKEDHVKKEEAIDKKEEARLKLKELIRFCSNKKIFHIFCKLLSYVSNIFSDKRFIIHYFLFYGNDFEIYL